MAVIAKRTEGEFVQLEAGSHAARCIGLYDVGTHHEEYTDKSTGETTKADKRKIILVWEVPGELTEGGMPMTVRQWFNLSLHEKSNLYRTLVGWRGRNFTDEELAGFDVETIVGVPCLLNVVHNSAGRAKVASVSKLPKGMTCPDAVHELKTFSMDTSTEEDLINIPEWVQKQVAKSIEGKPGAPKYKPAETGDGPAGDNDEDDIPF